MATFKPGLSAYNPAQSHFPFLDMDAKQKMQGLWAEGQARSIKREQSDAIKTHQRIEILVTRSREAGIVWSNDQKILEFLERPLGVHRESDLDVQPAAEEAVDESVECKQEWSEAAITTLADNMVTYSLSLLRSKGNSEEKWLTLKWIWGHDVYCYKKQADADSATYHPVLARDVPFTFQFCCRLAGLDYEAIRDGLERTIGRDLKAIGFNINKRKTP